MMHRLVASVAVRTGIPPDVLADQDPMSFNAMVRILRGDDRDVVNEFQQ